MSSISARSLPAASIDAAAVRALRGGESRAAFARRLGVTAHTVYRWELPDGAEEARRPRGDVLERLQRLAAGGPAGAPPAGAGPVRASDPAAVATAIEALAR